MKITTIKLLAVAVAITVVAGGALLLLPGHSHAQVVCPPTDPAGDPDADGFTNAEECNAGGLLNVLPCTPGSGEDRNSCMDPNSKDLFVILVKPSGSVIDARMAGQDPFAILKGTGITDTRFKLGIAIHQITESQAPNNRAVTTSQKAIRITESTDPAVAVTGICNQGNPNGLDACVVYTQKIVDFVTSKCPTGVACRISPSTTALPVDTVISTFIKNTIAHEASHSMKLATKYDSRYGGNHYKSGTNVVMDQSVSVTTGNGIATFSLPGTYAAADSPAAKLKN